MWLAGTFCPEFWATGRLSHCKEFSIEWSCLVPQGIGTWPGCCTTHAFMSRSTQLLQQIHPLDEMAVAEEVVRDPQPGANAEAGGL